MNKLEAKIDERNIVKSSEKLLKDYNEKNKLRTDSNRDKKNLDKKIVFFEFIVVVSSIVFFVTAIFSVIFFIVRDFHPDYIPLFNYFSIVSIIVLMFLVLFFYSNKKQNKKFDKLEQELNEVDEYIVGIITKKFHKDLKNQYGSTFVNEKAPYFGMKNGTYEIVLENGDSVYAEIEYNEKDSMNVRVVSKIETLTNKNPNASMNEDNKEFDLEEALNKD